MGAGKRRILANNIIPIEGSSIFLVYWDFSFFFSLKIENKIAILVLDTKNYRSNILLFLNF